MMAEEFWSKEKLQKALAEAYGLDVWGARYRLTLGLPMGAPPDEMWANWWRAM